MPIKPKLKNVLMNLRQKHNEDSWFAIKNAPDMLDKGLLTWNQSDKNK